MGTIKALSEADLLKMVATPDHGTILKWLSQGEGVAVYEDTSFIHYGHCKFLSYGLTTSQLGSQEPPHQCPEILGMSTNWAYRLVGTCQRPSVGDES